MHNSIYRFLIFVLLISGSVVWAAGNADAEMSEPTPVAEDEDTQGTSETAEFTPSELQEKMLDLGFRVPKEVLEAPDFTLQRLGGGETDLSSYQGKIVFLNFWATWCGPCRAEMPSMETLQQKYAGDDGLAIVAVDVRESADKVQKFVDDLDLTFDVLLDTTGKISSIYGARSIPTTYLLGRDGTILGLIIGSRDWDTAEVYEVFDVIVGSKG